MNPTEPAQAPRAPSRARRQGRRQLLGMPPRERVARMGHRLYTSGPDPELWYGIGKLQFHFLVAQGLRPDHVFLDVACGGLRLGQFLIPYLAEGHYHGLDGEPALVEQALSVEFFAGVATLKKPRFAFNYDFDVSFCERFDMAIAQSLFTHLTRADIRKCFGSLRSRADPGARFFFTYFEGDSAANPQGPSHAQLAWRYSFDELAEDAAATGWKASRIGAWDHPRHQHMALAVPAP